MPCYDPPHDQEDEGFITRFLKRFEKTPIEKEEREKEERENECEEIVIYLLEAISYYRRNTIDPKKYGDLIAKASLNGDIDINKAYKDERYEPILCALMTEIGKNRSGFLHIIKKTNMDSGLNIEKVYTGHLLQDRLRLSQYADQILNDMSCFSDHEKQIIINELSGKVI